MADKLLEGEGGRRIPSARIGGGGTVCDSTSLIVSTLSCREFHRGNVLEGHSEEVMIYGPLFGYVEWRWYKERAIKDWTLLLRLRKGIDGCGIMEAVIRA